VWQQHGPGGRQAHLSRVSFEQLKAQLGFQSLDPLREGGLGDVKTFSGSTEVA
jgi:hypothetical protein